jgi:prophage DNA circulation protein
MSWRDNLHPGSFRGVPFSVSATDGEIGRRTVLHEYPKRDLPYAEDMGRKAREFTLEALVLGDDYMAKRDRLIEALEKSGAGELVHPYRGRLRVAVLSARLSESTGQGGVARFMLTFIESGENTQPAATTDTAAVVDAAADAAQGMAALDFAELFSIIGSGFLAADALATILSALAGIRSAANGLLGNADIGPAYLYQLTAANNQAETLLTTPGDLALSVYDQVKAVGHMAGSAPGISALRNLFAWTAPANRDYPLITPPPTPMRAQQAVNRNAITALVRRAAIIEAARAASGASFDSRTDAATLRTELDEQLDDAAYTASDSVYRSLNGLRVAMIRHIDAVSLDLKPRVNYLPVSTQPALVLAYRLYGNATRDADIISRNRSVRHPGFVRGGIGIEVLES